MGPPDASARALVAVLLGDVVLPRGGAVWLQALSEVLGQLGVTPAAVRQAVRRLVGDGLLAARREGRRARYHLTADGRTQVADAVAPVRGTTSRAWDGQWRVLVYSFPEADRADRDRLRRDLAELGHGSAGTGTWVSPFDLGPRLDQRLAAHRDAGRVDRFVARLDGDDRDLARRAFDLEEVAARHQAFLETHSGQAAPDSDVEAVARRVALVHDWTALVRSTPDLPVDLLPSDWPGARVREAVRAALGQLTPSVDRWWALVERSPADGPQVDGAQVDGPRADGARVEPPTAPRPAPHAAAPEPTPAPASPAPVPVRTTDGAATGPAWSGFARTVALALADDAMVLGSRVLGRREGARGPHPATDEEEDACRQVAAHLRECALAWYVRVAGRDAEPMRLLRDRAPDQWRHAALADADLAGPAATVAALHLAVHALHTWLTALQASTDPALADLANRSTPGTDDDLRVVEALVAGRARDPRHTLATHEAVARLLAPAAWMFESLPGESPAVRAGHLPADSRTLRGTWWEAVDRSLRARGLVVPAPDAPRGPGGRRGLHDPSFVERTWTTLADSGAPFLVDR